MPRATWSYETWFLQALLAMQCVRLQRSLAQTLPTAPHGTVASHSSTASSPCTMPSRSGISGSSPNLYQVFTEFFGTRQLMVDINRCIFRPPVHPGQPTISYGSIHWDTDPRSGPESLQAVVLLTDVARNGGGFQCLPVIYQNLSAWLERYALRDDFDHFNPGLNDWTATQIEGKAGDVILWSTKLPHGTATNLSTRPRMAAFVSMTPPGDNAQLRDQMKTWWLTKRAPDYWRGMPGRFRASGAQLPTILSALGLDPNSLTLQRRKERRPGPEAGFPAAPQGVPPAWQD
jgi:hypothetical protein